MKYFLLFVSILTAFTPAYARNRPGSVRTIDERPLANAIRGALQNRPVQAQDIQYLIDQGIKEFNLRDFVQTASNARPLAEHQIGMQAFLQAPDGRRTNIQNPGRQITIEVTDGKGQKIELQTRFGYNKEGSPEAMYEAHAVNATKRINTREFIHNLPMESMVFYYGLGLSNILSLVTESYNDPKVFDRYVKSLVDPVAQASFVAFIIANRTGSLAMNSLLYSAVLSKTMSPRAKHRISTMLIPHLGMAIGGMASNVMHDLVSIVKPCSGAILNPDTTLEERKQLCDQAYKNVFSADNAYRYATSALAMISSGFIMMYGQAFLNFVKASGSRLSVVRSVQMVISTAVNFIPLPQVKLVTVLQTATKGAIHLVIFLKLDEWFIHPFWHHVVERYAQIGPKFQAFQNEMLERLQKTSVSTSNERISRPLNAEAERQLEQLTQEAIRRSSDPRTLFEKPAPANIPVTTTISRVFDIRFGNEPAPSPTPRGFMQSAALTAARVAVPGLATTEWFLLNDNKYNQKQLSFSELLEKHFEVSDRWRQSLLGKITRQYQSHLEMIAPFNAQTQMTYELYHDFFLQAANIHSSDDKEREEAKEVLFSDNQLYRVWPRDINGNLFYPSEHVFSSSLEEGETLTRLQQLQLNTVRQSVCWIDQFLQNVLMKKQSDMLTQHFQKIKSDFNQFPEDLVCQGHIGTLKRERNNIDLAKVKRGLVNLAWIMQRYSSDLNNQFFSHNVEVKSDNQTTGTNDKVYIRLNYMEQIQNFLGPFITLERGESFVAGWDASFKESQPDHFKLLNPYSPASTIFRRMACQVKPLPLIEHGKWFGTLRFNPPSVIPLEKSDWKLCDSTFRGLLSPAKDSLGYIMDNPKLGEYIDHILTNVRPEIFGEAPSGLVSLTNSISNIFSGPILRDTRANEIVTQYRSQLMGGPNRFNTWWDNTIESEITKKFKEINITYEKGLQKNLADKITSYDGNIDVLAVPDTLTLSYLGQMKIYMDFILRIYSSLQTDRLQVNRARDLRDAILQSMKNEIDISVRVSTDKNDVTRAHAHTLALLKKFKSLLLTPAFRSTSPYINGNSQESVDFRNSCDYFSEKLGYNRKATDGRTIGTIGLEWLNELDFRAVNDKFINQAFREYIEEVGKNYESLKPVYLSEHFRGNGIQPVKELFNYMATLSGEVYRLTKMTRLTTDSNFTELDNNGQETRGRGSRKAF